MNLLKALSDPTVLSLIIFLPTVAAFVLLFFPKGQEETMKQFSFTTTIIVFALTVWISLPGVKPDSVGFSFNTGEMQYEISRPWITAFDINYHLGLDGISLPLVVLTSFLSMLAMWASWPIQKHVRAYCILFLILETGMLGVFMSLDFFLFYVFWEVMLLPMYFLIGVWGGPRREYAAIKFFLFTLVGSVLMLIALLMLYFTSDLRAILPNAVVPHTFDIVWWARLAQMPNSPFAQTLFLGHSVGWWAFLLFFVGFVVKLPAVPVHTWLPDAHVEAPTPISMILAGVLLKMGGYGVLRICYPILPSALDSRLTWMVAIVGVVSMVYGAFAAMAQKDFKRLVAYSSVSHMGYVLLGIGVCSAVAGNQYDTNAWRMGISGAMFQMIAHGISSAGMFFLVGVVYDRVHHRDLDRFGGLFQHMPTYAGISLVIFFAALGLPGLCGFIGEVLVVLSVWKFSIVLAVIAAAVVILTAGYILWTIQRVYLGPEYKGPHAEALRPMTLREIAIAAPLVVMAVVLGVFPQSLLKYTDATINGLVSNLNPARQSASFSPAAAPVKPQVGATSPLTPGVGQGVRDARGNGSAPVKVGQAPPPSTPDPTSLVEVVNQAGQLTRHRPSTPDPTSLVEVVNQAGQLTRHRPSTPDPTSLVEVVNQAGQLTRHRPSTPDPTSLVEVVNQAGQLTRHRPATPDPTSLVEVVNQAGQLTRHRPATPDPTSLAEVVNQAGQLQSVA